MTTPTTTRVAWHNGPLLGLDLETTGVDVDQDRIVTASIVRVTASGVDRGMQRGVETLEWLVNPGIDIPTTASDIHGITTERAQADGIEPTAAIDAILTALAEALAAGTPIVGMNIVYDLTLLDRECARHGFPPLVGLAPVIDIRVLDKAVDRFRKGGRKLTDLCDHYGVRIDNAHESTSDAYAALRVAWKIAQTKPQMQIDPMELHACQVTWAAEQVAEFAAYRRRTGNPLDDEDGTWPIRPRKGGDRG